EGLFPSIGQLQSRPAPSRSGFLFCARGTPAFQLGQKLFQSEVQAKNRDRWNLRCSASVQHGIGKLSTEEIRHEGLVSHRSAVRGRDFRDHPDLTASDAARCRAERQSGAGHFGALAPSYPADGPTCLPPGLLLWRPLRVLLRHVLRELRPLLEIEPRERRPRWLRLVRGAADLS